VPLSTSPPPFSLGPPPAVAVAASRPSSGAPAERGAVFAAPAVARPAPFGGFAVPFAAAPLFAISG